MVRGKFAFVSFFLLIVALVGLCCGVAFADAPPGATPYYSGLVFDSVANGATGSVVPYPMAVCSPTQTDGLMSYQGGDFCRYTTQYVNGKNVGTFEMNYGGNARVEFRCADFVYDTAVSAMMDFGDYDVSVNVAGVVNYIVPDNEGAYYVAFSRPFSYSANLEGGYFSFSNMLIQATNESGVLSISDLLVSVETVNSVPSGYVFTVEAEAFQTPVDFMARWLDGMRLPVANKNFSGFGDFVVGTLGSFLSFEILPNVSFGGILAFIATICIVLWFITLLV